MARTPLRTFLANLLPLYLLTLSQVRAEVFLHLQGQHPKPEHIDAWPLAMASDLYIHMSSLRTNRDVTLSTHGDSSPFWLHSTKTDLGQELYSDCIVNIRMFCAPAQVTNGPTVL